jgi:hypothetical protein
VRFPEVIGNRPAIGAHELRCVTGIGRKLTLSGLPVLESATETNTPSGASAITAGLDILIGCTAPARWRGGAVARWRQRYLVE